jgi:hypothetical protein
MKISLSCKIYYPLPDLPPRGKETPPFPPWGKMKGGLPVIVMNTNLNQEIIN